MDALRIGAAIGGARAVTSRGEAFRPPRDSKPPHPHYSLLSPGFSPNATHRFHIPDMQGHVRQVTDIDGDAIAEYQYDAWGLIQLTAASAMAFGDWGYTWDGKPGRYYVQQRHLRADLG